MLVSMSRHYGRGYHRRGTPVCQTSFPIDKLFKENSNRPSAARSAGTIGKWGITSFTTIRNSSYEPSYSKYSSFRNQNQNINSGNSYSNDENKAKQDGPPKPKKFFKSRNTEITEESAVSPTSTVLNNDLSSKSPVKKNKEVGTTSKKVYSSKTPPKNNDQSPTDEYKPPIVLRIFKGTSCIVADGEKVSPTITSPTSPKARSSPTKPEKTLLCKQEKSATSTRSSRRRSFQDISETGPSSPKPKRARKDIMKDPEIESIISQLVGDNESDENLKTCDIVPIDPVSAQENTNQVNDDASDDSLPLACTSYFAKKENSEAENLEEDVQPEKASEEEPEVKNDDNIVETKLENTLSNIVDKILSSPKEITEKPVEVEKEIASAVDPEAPTDEKDFESGSESSDTANQCSVTLTSKVESGGLKLVIKKTPETIAEKEQNNLDSEGNKEETSAPVKVLPVKKKSIFKSRGKDESGNSSKRLALYKHNWNTSQAVEANSKQTTPASGSQYEHISDFDLGSLTRVSSEQSDGSRSLDDVTKVKCDRKDKGVSLIFSQKINPFILTGLIFIVIFFFVQYYTVVRNVKKAHQIQESGEFQEFNDDVDYILDALKDNNPVGTRCLSAITLAGKCMAPAFRMHVRAHGTVAKFFKALHDATTDQSLGKLKIFGFF